MMFAGAARTHVSRLATDLPDLDVPARDDATACCWGAAFLPRADDTGAVSARAGRVVLLPDWARCSRRTVTAADQPAGLSWPPGHRSKPVHLPSHRRILQERIACRCVRAPRPEVGASLRLHLDGDGLDRQVRASAKEPSPQPMRPSPESGDPCYPSHDVTLLSQFSALRL